PVIPFLCYDPLTTALYTLSLHDALPIFPGVTVSEKGTTNSTSTNNEGMFTLNVSSSSSILVVNFLGMQAQEISVGNQSNITVTQDRKSTRLNSSHVKISYAVFCLKKKIR